MLAAHMLEAKFLEYTIEITDIIAESYLNQSGAFPEYCQLVNDLDQIDNSRGGYEARKLSKLEKELKRG
jgi:hypothetical protein